MTEKGHSWRFRRIGGVDQVVLTTGDDISALSDLDSKLWVVLEMPIAQHRAQDALALLDEDGDGRVRILDILRTIRRSTDAFATLDILFEETTHVSPEMFKDARFREACGYAAFLAECMPSLLDLDAVEKAIFQYNERALNGDGVVVPEAAETQETADFINVLIAAGYQVMDNSGKAGVDGETIRTFAHDAKAVLDWRTEGNALSLDMPLALFDTTIGLFQSLSPAIDDYFRKCAILGIAGNEDVLKELSARIASILSVPLGESLDKFKALPLALPRIDGLLPLEATFNPLYADRLEAFFKVIRDRYSLNKTLDKKTWEKISTEMQRALDWLSRKPIAAAQQFPSEFLEAASDVSFGVLNEVSALIDKDMAEGPRLKSLQDLRDILILKRDFLTILRNFVAMDEFYAGRGGIFQSGKLFIDGRQLDLCLDVKNHPAHASMAGLSAMYLIYCDISRTTGEKGSIVAALTAGDADRIYVGRNAVYLDREGLDWNATVTKVITQPISIREAFLSPYKWLARTIEELATRRAASAESSRQGQMKNLAQKAIEQPTKVPQEAEQIIPKKVDVGTVAAIGVALGSIGAMITSILGLFIGMGAWMPIGIIGVFILISGPSMILAAIKLQKRDLSPLLNAEGWAINGTLKLNLIFGATLSHLAALPPNSIRTLNDPYAPKKKPWGWYVLGLLIILIIVAWLLGWLDPIIAFFK